MIANKCEDCDFWSAEICRRYPPTVTPQAVQRRGNVIAGQRPSPVSFVPVMSHVQTKADDWCGEFQNDT